MAAASTTTHDSILKTLYPQSEIQKLMVQKSPFYGLVPKKSDFEGANLVLALRYGNVAGRSALFSEAQANKVASQLVKFTITRARDYALFSIDNELIQASKGDKGSIVRAVTTEVDSAFDALASSVSSALYRNGGGAIGQISTGSTVSSTSITLADPNDVVNFEVGMYVQTASTDGTSGSLNGSGAKIQITAINQGTGVLTASAAWNTITGTATSDYIFQAGDFGAKIKGLAAWVPSTAPGATAFFGVDRSVDTQRLGGIRVSGTASLSIEEAIQKALQNAYRAKAKVSHVFINDVQFYKLVLELGSKRMYTEAINEFGVKYEGLKVVGPGGTVSVYADPYCPVGYGYALQMDTWSLRSAGEFPMFLNKDGRSMLDEQSADALEGRVGGYFQLCCDAPGFNAVFPLSTT